MCNHQNHQENLLERLLKMPAHQIYETLQNELTKLRSEIAAKNHRKSHLVTLEETAQGYTLYWRLDRKVHHRPLVDSSLEFISQLRSRIESVEDGTLTLDDFLKWYDQLETSFATTGRIGRYKVALRRYADNFNYTSWQINYRRKSKRVPRSLVAKLSRAIASGDSATILDFLKN